MNRFNYIIYQKNFRDFAFIDTFINTSNSDLCSNQIVLEFSFDYNQSSCKEVLGIFFLICELLTFQKGLLIQYPKRDSQLKTVGFKINLHHKRCFIFFEKFFIYFLNLKPFKNYKHVKIKSGGFFLFDFPKDTFFYDFSKKINQRFNGNDFSATFRCVFIYRDCVVFKQNFVTQFLYLNDNLL